MAITERVIQGNFKELEGRRFMLHVDHIGYAVKRMDKAIKSFEILGYKFQPIIRDESRKIDITFGEFDGYRVEIICPFEKGSPVDGVIEAVGNTPYHICYRSDDFNKDIEDLCDIGGGYKIMIKPEEAVAFGGRRVCFLYSLGCGLTEIVE